MSMRNRPAGRFFRLAEHRLQAPGCAQKGWHFLWKCSAAPSGVVLAAEPPKIERRAEAIRNLQIPPF